MSFTMEKPTKQANDRVGSRYENTLFVLHVKPKEADMKSTAKTSSSVLTELMPSGTTPLVISDYRGGMSSRNPSRVQLFTKNGLCVILFSHTLVAENVADLFVKCRSIHDPRARAAALKEMLSNFHAAEHTFSLAAFDDTARAFVAWTPRSAPISFGHHADGSVVVVGSLPRSQTLVGRQMDGDVDLVHLPAGRFLYGHGYLKPYEFTSMWSTATGNRSGTRAQVATTSPEKRLTGSPLVENLDKPKLSPTESLKWRWAKTGSRAEVANSWRKVTPTPTPAPPAAAEEKKVPVNEVMTTANAVSKIAAVAEAVVARAAEVNGPTMTYIAEKKTASSLAVPAATTAKAVDPETAMEQLFTFGLGAVIFNLMRGSVGRINRFNMPDKRFLTLLLMRVAVLTSSTPISEEEVQAQMSQALRSKERKQQEVQTVGVYAAASRTFAAMMRATNAGWSAAAAGAKKAREVTKSSRRKRSPLLPANGDGSGTSVVICQLNGTCCIGNACFV